VPKVLVAGASGVVGEAALRHFSSRPRWTAVGVARRPPTGFDCVAVDLADEAACRDVFGAMTDVTHLVYAALYEKPGLLAGWYEADQMERNLLLLRNLFEPLSAASTLQHVSLLQGTKAYGAHVGAVVQPGRERAPRHDHANFYWLQEDYLRSRRDSASWALTIVRPQVVFGEALGSNMNAIPALGVYAALCRLDGRPLDLPGPGAMVTEAVDAELLARAFEWAATNEAAWDETFNITNGDVFTMRGVWPVLADAFGMEAGDVVPSSLAETMPPREADWVELCERFSLDAPRSFDRFVGQGFVYADVFLGAPGGVTLVSTIKARQAGFADCVDTEDMFRRLIGRFQDRNLLPPRRW
jgi:nucleoside-diphosphate-sugar epimerase